MPRRTRARSSGVGFVRSSTSGCSLLIIISARAAGEDFRQFARMQHALDRAIDHHVA